MTLALDLFGLLALVVVLLACFGILVTHGVVTLYRRPGYAVPPKDRFRELDGVGAGEHVRVG
jgi:hypothetical protein